MAQHHSPGTARRISFHGPQARLSCDRQTGLHVTAVSPHVVRVRYAPKGRFLPDFSYALAEWPLPAPDFPFEWQETRSFVELRTEGLRCRIEKKGLKVALLSADGKRTLLADGAGFHWEEDDAHGGHIVKMTKHAPPHECYYGLGDKSCRLNLRGRKAQMWCTDAFAYQAHTDPLYKAIPFYFGRHDAGQYGVFFDNSHRSFFDFASTRPDAASFWALGGEMNYYLIAGDSLLDIAARYARLTGLPELPPLWALGFHQCKWSYYPQAEVEALAAKFRELRIPCDCLYLDIDYMDGYRCFTWDRQKFPDPPGMVAKLRGQGFKTIAMIDPGIKIDPDYPVYRQGIERGYFMARPDGDLLEASVWPGPCHFPDFTRAEARDWWGNLYEPMIRRDGIAGFWNDMNEPAVFGRAEKTVPEDARHHYEGYQASHRKVHNVYGMQMARASYEGIKRWAYPKRPFLIARAMYAGAQRYALAWTGDNQATWEHLKIANTQCQRLSVSGVSFVGTDIGGFDGVPSGELFTRWIQLGAFHPFFRVHSIGDHLSGALPVDAEAIAAKKKESQRVTDQEPWSFGEPYTSIVRAFIELRYRLLPYWYTAFWQYARTGMPMLRPLSFLDPDDPETHYREEEFGVGDALLVCPISAQGASSRRLYLPEGNWYHYWDDAWMEGGHERSVTAPLDQIPLFVKAGAVLPMFPAMQHVGERPVEAVDLRAYWAPGAHESQWYADAGDGYGHLEGEWCLHRWTLVGSGGGLRLEQRMEGGYRMGHREYRVSLHGGPKKSLKAQVWPSGEWILPDEDGTWRLPAAFESAVWTAEAP
jgi:alpha-glucosidase